MITFIKILKDNYIWFLSNKSGKCIIVDAGHADPILNKLREKKWDPIALLITHKHKDHTNGIKKIIDYYPNLNVIGPLETKNLGIKNIVSEFDQNINILGYNIKVLDTPGHTLHHVSYYIKPYLFCGDTLFSGGCGKVYKDCYHLMYHSLQKIMLLPDDTLIFCGHEYTLHNMKFFLSIFPKNQEIKKYFEYSQNLLKSKNNTLPTTLKQEKKINFFLKTNEMSTQTLKYYKYNFSYPWNFFKYLRILKNNFK